MKQMLISEVVLNYDLYPRRDVDSQHVGHMAESLNAGVKLPPIVIDRKTKCVVDGFHRIRAYNRVFGDNAKIPVVERDYKSEADIFLDAMRFNSAHGRALTSFDRAHCIIASDRFAITPDQVASALNITVETIGKLTADRVGKLQHHSQTSVPLKRTIRHMRGKSLTKAQLDVNIKLSGMSQSFYVNHIIMLIESDLLDTDNESLMAKLGKLHGLLDTVCVEV